MVAALASMGVTAPFPIQTAAIPDALAGSDVLGRAHTGSGKTVAFALPVVARVKALNQDPGRGRPAGLILVPTRELAAQVSATVAVLGRAVGLRVATIHGGVSAGPQTAALRRGVEVVVATPGRLEDLIAQGHCRLNGVRVTVLDEADQLADMGFLPSVRRLLAQTPPNGQRLLFSATLDGVVDGLARDYLRQPVTHSIHPPDAGPGRLEHHLLTVRAVDRVPVVAELAAGSDRCLLFTRTKHGARKLTLQLGAMGIGAVELHANLTQGARERNLDAFASGRVRVLVATDIAARGIHVDELSLVVHVDPPAEHKAYLHRSGRTGRAGAGGTVVTLASPEQTGDVKTMLRKAKVSFNIAEARAGDGNAAALVEESCGSRRSMAPPRPGGQLTGSTWGGGPVQAARPQRRLQPVEPTAGPPGAGSRVGTVRWFSPAKGYGFITPDGGTVDLFVHHSSIEGGGVKVLAPGQRVRFEAARGDRGRQATRVHTA